jgi:formate hydrogenlyase subunit 3/multisubunit Na+/H+ antiporter MnhD subunit
MLAFSSIAQMGYILMGVGLYLYMPAEAEIGLWGGLLHIITHSFMKGGAFLCAGALIYGVGTREMKDLNGIGRHYPAIGIAFAIFALSLAGVPPLSGFVSELLIVRAGIDIANAGEGIGRWALIFTAAIIINSVLSLGYYLPAVNRILFSQDMTPLAKKGKVLPYSITVPIVVMAGLTILLGVYPDLGLWLVEPAVDFFNDFVDVTQPAGGA